MLLLRMLQVVFVCFKFDRLSVYHSIRDIWIFMMIVEPEGGLVAVLFLKTFYVLIIGKFNVLHNIYSECGYIIYI